LQDAGLMTDGPTETDTETDPDVDPDVDAGASPDVGPDAGADSVDPDADAGEPLGDAGFPTLDGGDARPAASLLNEGCGCTLPGHRNPPAPWRWFSVWLVASLVSWRRR